MDVDVDVDFNMISFLDKKSISFSINNLRDKKGTILYFYNLEITGKISKLIFKELKLKYLNKPLFDFDKKKIQLYYEKYFYMHLLPIISQLIISKQINSLKEKTIICDMSIKEISHILFPILLSFDLPVEKLQFKFNYKKKIKEFLIDCFPLAYIGMNIISKNFIYNFFYLKKKNFCNIQNNKSKIAVKYNFGLNDFKRNDLFWLDKEKINSSRILIYFDLSEGSSLNIILSNDFIKIIQSIEKNGFSWIIIDKAKYRKKHLSHINFKRNNLENNINLNWFNKNYMDLIDRVLLWEKIFVDLNVKIHVDINEWTLETNIKNIALDKTNSLSIGFELSAVNNYKWSFWGYYSNNVFFSWSNQSKSNYLKTNNLKETILVSGFPFGKLANLSIIKSKNLTTQYFNNNINFTICLLDNTHSYNESIFQVVYTPDMESFYFNFLNWANQSSDVGIIIKSKRKKNLLELKSIQPLLKKLIDEKKCFVVPDQLGSSPLLATYNTDIVVSTGIYMSTALLETIIYKNRGVFFDYAYAKKELKSIYSWGYNKVIFDNKDIMFNHILNFKAKKESYLNIGDWSEYITNIVSFDDHGSYKRISNYISWIMQGYQNGLSKDKIINRANQKYSENYKIN